MWALPVSGKYLLLLVDSCLILKFLLILFCILFSVDLGLPFQKSLPAFSHINRAFAWWWIKLRLCFKTVNIAGIKRWMSVYIWFLQEWACLAHRFSNITFFLHLISFFFDHSLESQDLTFKVVVFGNACSFFDWEAFLPWWAWLYRINMFNTTLSTSPRL